MRIVVKDIGGREVLAGAQDGSVAFAKMLKAASREPRDPEPLFIDFAGVEVATASYLRESVLALRDRIRGRRSTLYPVIANANDVIKDELGVLVRARGDVLLLCKVDDADRAFDFEQLGDLDPKQQMTLDAVRERGEIDAAELMRDFGKTEGVNHTTAWNNRLAALSLKGLLMEITRGRSKRYRPVFEGL